VERYLAMPIHAATGEPSLLCHLAKPGVVYRTRAHWRPQPCVVPAAMHAEHTAHRGQPEFSCVFLHERVLHPDCLAKYAAAFFRMSRSSVTRRSSACNRLTSALCSTGALADAPGFPNF